LVIYPDGKQQFVELSNEQNLRVTELAKLFEGEAPQVAGTTGDGKKISPTSMAYRLKFVQAVYMETGSGKAMNKAAEKFCGIPNYKGQMAFLRKEEVI